MTEEWWLSTDDALALLEILNTPRETSERKLHLFAAWCCRRMEYLFFDPRQQAAVDVLERYADGFTDADDLVAAESALLDVDLDDPDRTPHRTPVQAELEWLADMVVLHAMEHEANGTGMRPLQWRTATVANFVVRVGEELDRYNSGGGAERREREWLREAFHCIFGNPFRSVAFADSWRTETAVSLANGIYEERAFDRLPILADALEEAGCDHLDLLTHCRGPGPHARGCWVVDGVLGKT